MERMYTDTDTMHMCNREIHTQFHADIRYCRQFRSWYMEGQYIIFQYITRPISIIYSSIFNVVYQYSLYI